MSGHSGCRIQLHHREDAGSYLVRKLSASEGYNGRLQEQKRKQESMRALGFPCPAVLGDGHAGDLYFFDMDYVIGKSLADVLEHSDNDTLQSIADCLTDILNRCAATARGVLPPSLFLEKIDSIVANPPPVADERDRTDIRSIGERLRRHDWDGIPATLSHGDMTVENIILSGDGAFHFIDFLDGPLSSHWLDMAKLHQDLRAHWFLRDTPDELRAALPHRTLQIAANRLATILRDGLQPIWPELFQRLTSLVQFQLFRIVPYCRHRDTLAFVVQGIRNLEQNGERP